MAFFKRDDIVIKYGGDDSRFQKVNRRVMTTGKKLKGFFADVGSSISGMFGRTLIGTIAAVGAAFATLTKRAISFGDSIAKTADKIGINVEALQQLRYAAKVVGVEQGTLDMGLQRFSRRIGEAANGTGELYKDIERLGIELRNADGTMRPLTEIMFDFADAVAAADSKQEQLRLTFKAVDSEAAGLVNLFRQGGDGMRYWMDRAVELGLVLDENLVRKAEVVEQAWDEFWSRQTTKLKRFALNVVQFLGGSVQEFMTLEEVQAALAEKRLTLEKAQRQAEQSRNANARASARRRVSELTEEIKGLEEKEAIMRRIAAIEAGNINASGGATGGTTKTGTAGSRAVTTDDWRTKTPEQIGAALSDFRSGRISQWELPIPIKVRGELVWEDEISNRADETGGRD